MTTILHAIARSTRSERPADARGLFDRWFDRWAALADARWRSAGDPHRGRYY